jgi:hypothetical protein
LHTLSLSNYRYLDGHILLTNSFTNSLSYFQTHSIETDTSRATAAAKSRGVVEEGPAPVGFFQAFLLPNVLNYAVAFGFFKLVS